MTVCSTHFLSLILIDNPNILQQNFFHFSYKFFCEMAKPVVRRFLQFHENIACSLWIFIIPQKHCLQFMDFYNSAKTLPVVHGFLQFRKNIACSSWIFIIPQKRQCLRTAHIPCSFTSFSILLLFGKHILHRSMFPKLLSDRSVLLASSEHPDPDKQNRHLYL